MLHCVCGAARAPHVCELWLKQTHITLCRVLIKDEHILGAIPGAEAAGEGRMDAPAKIMVNK